MENLPDLLMVCKECEGHKVIATQNLHEVENYVREIVSGWEPKAIKPPIPQDMYIACPTCKGKGVVLTPAGREVASVLVHFGLVEDSFMWGYR